MFPGATAWMRQFKRWIGCEPYRVTLVLARRAVTSALREQARNAAAAARSRAPPPGSGCRAGAPMKDGTNGHGEEGRSQVMRTIVGVIAVLALALSSRLNVMKKGPRGENVGFSSEPAHREVPAHVVRRIGPVAPGSMCTCSTRRAAQSR